MSETTKMPAPSGKYIYVPRVIRREAAEKIARENPEKRVMYGQEKIQDGETAVGVGDG